MGEGPRWAAGLRAAAGPGYADAASRERENDENRVADLAERLIERRLAEKTSARAPAAGGDAAPGPVAAFWRRRPREGTPQELVEREARLRYMQERCQEVLTDKELDTLHAVMRKHCVAAGEPGEPGPLLMSYGGFCLSANHVVQEVGERAAWQFTPSLFARFQQTDTGLIDFQNLIAVLVHRNRRLQNRILLGSYDRRGDGALERQDLEAFVDDMQAQGFLLAVRNVPPNFRPKWLRVCTQKFLFLHGVKGQVKVKDLASSPALQELQALYADPYETGSIQANLLQLRKNWFSVYSAQRVHHLFADLDRDMDGALSPDEFQPFGGGGLTDVFVQRVFEVHALKRRSGLGRHGGGGGGGGGMGMDAFVDFVVAWENKKLKPALRYFFDIFDLRGQGYLTHVEFHTFFREVSAKLSASGQEETKTEDVHNEVFDMVKPAVEGRITFADLWRSDCGATVVDILADVHGFWRYDNRESLMHDEEDEDEDGPAGGDSFY